MVCISDLWSSLEAKFIKISNGTNQVRTIIARAEIQNNEAIPLVMLHGMGSGETIIDFALIEITL